MKDIGIIFMLLIVLNTVYWTASSIIVEISTPYSFGKKEYEFIEKYGLNDCSIMGEWETIATETDSQYDINDITSSLYITCLQPYLYDGNYVNGVLEYKDNYSYFHKVPQATENEDRIESIKKCEMPEILIGNPDIYLFYGNTSKLEYSLVMEDSISMIWKGISAQHKTEMYIRNDVVAKKNIEIIEKQ